MSTKPWVVLALFGVFVNAQTKSSLIGYPSVLASGAKGDGSTDDQPSIQRSLNAAIAASGFHSAGTVLLPPATVDYRISKPLVIAGSNFSLIGSGSKSRITPTYPSGPALIVRSENYPVISGSLGAPLLPMPGGATSFSWTTTTNDQKYLNMTDAAGTLSGATAFTIEENFSTADTTFWNATDFSAVTLFDINSVYEYQKVGGRALTFRLAHLGSLPVQLCALDAIGSYSYATPIPVNVPHSLCTSGAGISIGAHQFGVSYDGTNIRLFIDGVLSATEARSGTLFVPAYSSLTFGDYIIGGSWPDGEVGHTSINASYDNIRISNVARHTATYTPPTQKFTSDSSTVYLLTFSNNFDVFTQIGGSLGNSWAWLRNGCSDSCPSDGSVQLSNIDIVGASGIVVASSPRVKIDKTVIRPLSGYGLYLFGNSYEGKIDAQILAGGSTLYAAAFNATSSLIQANILADGSYYPIVISGISINCSGCVAQTEIGTVIPINVVGIGNASVNLAHSEVESENTGPDFQYAYYLGSAATGQQDTVDLSGATIESAKGFVFNRYAKLNLDHALIHNLGSAASYVVNTDATTLPVGSVSILGLTQDVPIGIIDHPWLAQCGGGTVCPVNFSDLPTAPNGLAFYCADCKNFADDITGTFDSTAAGSGHGTNVLRENGAWRVH